MQKIATWRGYIASAVQAGSLAKIQRGRSGSNGSEAEQVDMAYSLLNKIDVIKMSKKYLCFIFIFCIFFHFYFSCSFSYSTNSGV